MTAMATTCERCGSGVSAGASTCPNCGAPVGAAAYETRKVDAGWSAPEVPISAEPETPVYEPTIKVPEPPAVEPVPPVFIPPSYAPPPAPSPSRRSRVWQIVAGCVALFVICCCLAVVAGVIVYGQMGGF